MIPSLMHFHMTTYGTGTPVVVKNKLAPGLNELNRVIPERFEGFQMTQQVNIELEKHSSHRIEVTHHFKRLPKV